MIDPRFFHFLIIISSSEQSKIGWTGWNWARRNNSRQVEAKNFGFFEELWLCCNHAVCIGNCPILNFVCFSIAIHATWSPKQIPNPLFDLAGVTCGYLLISFWTFFGATFVGKALIKVNIQVLYLSPYRTSSSSSYEHNTWFLHTYTNILILRLTFVDRPGSRYLSSKKRRWKRSIPWYENPFLSNVTRMKETNNKNNNTYSFRLCRSFRSKSSLLLAQLFESLLKISKNNWPSPTKHKR